ncbi:MAG: AAA family ATPase [Bacteroidia bacterium]|nr:AAA family ATPase [Bacteroidia bacterium]
MATPDTSNHIFNLAADLVNNTSQHIFLTGKAGTGKTTFLKYVKAHTHKNAAIVAPTGVAAINAGGVTMHSFFQLPFGPFIPGNKGALPMMMWQIKTRFLKTSISAM